MKTSLILPRRFNHLFFYKLFGGNFCEQPLVLGKLLNTVKWSTFWVSFIRVLTALGWLWCIEIFKIDYLVTTNVRFGTVSINQVTYVLDNNNGEYALAGCDHFSNSRTSQAKQSCKSVQDPTGSWM